MKLPRFTSIGISAGIVGGASSLFVIALLAPWLYGGKPAHPTTLGYLLIVAYGAAMGSVLGAVVGALVSRSRPPSRFQGISPTIQLLAFFGLCAVIVATIVPLTIPFATPIPLELD